jgi:TfoX/Sxy family transcriptional regulator of competence genes
MAYSKDLAGRVRGLLAAQPELREAKMFGGVCYLLNGNMACGVLGEELIVRVGAEKHDQALAKPGARVFDYTGRAMKGWVMVGASGLGEEALEEWVRQGVEYALGLPPKEK